MIGKTLAQYEITGKLGEGGMGEVYRARDTRLERPVAIKVLPPEFAGDTERLARFRREARLLASLNHTHVASLYGLEEAEGQVFLVMELVEGEDLSERLERGQIDQDEALEYARQFAEGLEAAHEQNIVHRDLKPANLIINTEGQLKILDFGLARAFIGDNDEDSNLDHSPTITTAQTRMGVILGTAAYMSPEQARGRKVDQRTDIWAFGAILFEMLSGKRLFQGETISDIMAAVLRADPPWDALPEGTPRGVRRLLERCLERDARRRLRDIGEARVRLERWRDDPRTMQDSFASGIIEVAAAPSRSRNISWGLCGVAILIAAFFGWRLATVPEAPPRLLDLEINLVEGKDLSGAGSVTMLSPDGDWIAWRTDEGIWLREVSRRQPHLLEDTEGSASMCFSPDSQWLAFAGRGLLRRVSISGGTPITICEVATPRGVAWVDATTLVYSASISTGLMQVDLASGEIHALTAIDTTRSERSHRWPTKVPGQRAVVFECQFLGRDYDESDIQVVSLDAGERRTIHRGGGAPMVTHRGQLLFVRSHTLFAVQFDVDTGTTSGLPVPVREDVVSSVGNQEDDDGSAQYSLDLRGSLLYLDTRGATNQMSRLAWLDLKTGGVAPFGPSARHGVVMLSPDAKLAVVSRFRDGDDNLYVHDLESGNESMLTYRPSVEYIGAWSPDSRVFYWSQSSDSGDRFEVWRRAVDGSSPPEFVVASPTTAGIWPKDISFDGRYLACSAWMGGNLRDILILDLQDLEAGFTPFAPNERDHDDFHWFAPGFVTYREGLGNAGSLLLRRFPDDGALWNFPDLDTGYWSATANAAGDAAIADGPDGIYRFPVDFTDGRVRIGSRETLRTWTIEETQRVLWSTQHPDGERILVLYSDDPMGVQPAPQMVLVTGWLQEVESRLERGH